MIEYHGGLLHCGGGDTTVPAYDICRHYDPRDPPTVVDFARMQIERDATMMTRVKGQPWVLGGRDGDVYCESKKLVHRKEIVSMESSEKN